MLLFDEQRLTIRHAHVEILLRDMAVGQSEFASTIFMRTCPRVR